MNQRLSFVLANRIGLNLKEAWKKGYWTDRGCNRKLVALSITRENKQTLGRNAALSHLR